MFLDRVITILEVHFKDTTFIYLFSTKKHNTVSGIMAKCNNISDYLTIGDVSKMLQIIGLG